MSSDLFHPEKLLAVGPAAKVYRGVESGTGRKVLIKALLEDHEASHPLDREQLQLLAPSLMQLRHPHIAGLITLLAAEDEFAFVYEFMPGISGRAFPAEKKTTPADLRALAIQLMHGLLVGEHLRLPHGDLKPSNLIVADHPGGGLFLQIQDWGLSLARQEPCLESLWFRAPERHRGGALTMQSDLFTAAASLFYLATGAAPAVGNSPEEILADLATFDLRGSLAMMRPDIDPAMIDWLAWLLQPVPEQRPLTVAQALEVLMHSMHTGFVFQEKTAPQMSPGARTGPLVVGPATLSIRRAPRPPTTAPLTPVVAPAPRPAAVRVKATTPAVAGPSKSSRTKVLLGILINLGALAAVLYACLPMLREGSWKRDSAESPPQAVPAMLSAVTPSGDVVGRYLRISLEGKAVLSLAEVQVFSEGRNVAPEGKATQSTDFKDCVAGLAIDGKTDGSKAAKSLAQTHYNGKNPHWQLDLGRDMPLNAVVLWNRTEDEKYIGQLNHFTLTVLDAGQNVVWRKQIDEVPRPQLRVQITR